MQALDNLRETGGTRRQVFVTRKALGGPLARDQWLLGFEILGVRGRRAVAHFARHAPMEGLALDFPLTVVALDAYLPARVSKRLRGDYANSVGSVVTRFAERCRHEAGPHHHQQRHRHHEHNGQTDNLIRNVPDLQEKFPDSNRHSNSHVSWDVTDATANHQEGGAKRF